MTAADRLADRLLRRAAARWPGELAGPMLGEWRAELAALGADATRGRLTRTRDAVTFAASLALATPPDRPDRTVAAPLTEAAGAAAAVLLAGAVANLTHVATGSAGRTVPVGALALAQALLLGAAALGGARLGALLRRYAPGGGSRPVILLGVAAYLFLWLGNDTPVMPFMGWRDIAPAVGAWTLAGVATAAGARRLRGTGRSGAARWWVWTGSLLAVEAAAVAGGWHGAGVLGTGRGAAPAWLPLALLPGGLLPGVPAAPATLLGNASAMLLPLALCSALLAGFLTAPAGPAPAHPRPEGAAPRRVAVAALAGLALPLLVPALLVAPTGDAAAAGLDRHAIVFGFGFLAAPWGRLALAALTGLLAAARPAAGVAPLDG
jgi:hypothetical protein